MASKIQSILFDINEWTASKAQRWLSTHNYYPIKKVHVTPHYLRYRLREPLTSDNYRWIEFGNNIYAIIAYPKQRKRQKKRK